MHHSMLTMLQPGVQSRHLSEISIAEGGAPQAIPDFTRGRWYSRKPVFALGDDF